MIIKLFDVKKNKIYRIILTTITTPFFALNLFDSTYTLTNCDNPDEMPHNTAFHLGKHCLQNIKRRGPLGPGLLTLVLAHEEIMFKNLF